MNNVWYSLNISNETNLGENLISVHFLASNTTKVGAKNTDTIEDSQGQSRKTSKDAKMNQEQEQEPSQAIPAEQGWLISGSLHKTHLTL